jgi:hypothetical protein
MIITVNKDESEFYTFCKKHTLQHMRTHLNMDETHMLSMFIKFKSHNTFILTNIYNGLCHYKRNLVKLLK